MTVERVSTKSKGRPIGLPFDFEFIGGGDWTRTSDLGVMNPSL